MENYDLLYTRWEDDIIWDSENMDHIPGMLHKYVGREINKNRYEITEKIVQARNRAT